MTGAIDEPVREAKGVTGAALDRGLKWRDLLLLLDDEDTTEVLAPFCQRIDAMVSHRTRPRKRGSGEPDGVDGLTRRGSYERLLASEWVLADVAPLEFVRRAGSQEHTFFSLARQADEGAVHSIVYFDAGPSQLGAPRLCHLAILLVLAARAERLGAQFYFRPLQSKMAFHRIVDDSALSRLLKARSALEVGADDVERALREESRVADDGEIERWFVGDTTLYSRFCAMEQAIEAPASSSPSEQSFSADYRMEVSEHVALDASATLEIVFREEQSGPKTLALPRPKREVTTRLLRDPFAHRRATAQALTTRLDPEGGIVFSPSGRRLLARTRTGHATALSIPNSPNQKPGKPKDVRITMSGMQVVAAGFVRRRAFAIGYGEGEIRVFGLQGVNSHSSLPIPQGQATFSSTPKPISAAFLLPEDHPTPASIVFQDHAHVLHRLVLNDQSASNGPEKITDKIVAISHTGNKCCIAVEHEDRGVVDVLTLGNPTPGKAKRLRLIQLEKADGSVQGFATLGGTESANTYGMLSLFPPGHPPKFFGPADDIAPPDFDVVGAIGGVKASSWRGPSVVKLDGERRRLVAHNGTSVVVSSLAPSPIVATAISPTTAAVGYLTRDGDVGVFSFEHECVLLDVRDIDQ